MAFQRQGQHLNPPAFGQFVAGRLGSLLGLVRLIGGEDVENLDDIDLRATEICVFPGQRYE